MKKIAFIFALMPLSAMAESDAQIALNNAVEVVKTHCLGIAGKMENIKKVAGIGTAVNAVGTVAGVGGEVAAGVKYKKDMDTAKGMGTKAATDIVIAKLKGIELSEENQALIQMSRKITPDFESNIDKLVQELESEEAKEEKISELEQESTRLQKEINKSQRDSIVAGNVRTGLFAVDTATNVAGAVISSKTVANESLVEQIQKCTSSLDVLRNAHTRVRVEDGLNEDNTLLMERTQHILNKCSEYEYVNIQQINNLAKGAMISNSIGSVTGAAATITSALGNNKKVSNMNFTTEEGIKQYKQYENINVASNVLGGVTTAASLTGTILNASQIKTAKKIINISEECEGALQW